MALVQEVVPTCEQVFPTCEGFVGCRMALVQEAVAVSIMQHARSSYAGLLVQVRVAESPRPIPVIHREFRQQAGVVGSGYPQTGRVGFLRRA